MARGRARSKARPAPLHAGIDRPGNGRPLFGLSTWHWGWVTTGEGAVIDVSAEAKDEEWEPGAPSLRAFAPGLVGGALVPLAVYYATRPHVSGDAPALMIAGAPAAAWVAFEWIRRRRLDPIGGIVLAGFILGIAASLILGGSSFVLKVRDSGFTCVFGMICLVSLVWRRPVMFFIGRALSAGDDPGRVARYDELWDLPTGPRTFRIITAAWGVGLIGEASLRVGLAMMLPTGTFVAVSPAQAGVVLGGLFLFTVWFSRRAQALARQRLAAEG